MTCPTQPWRLRWRDVDPSKHALDLQAAREIADRLLPQHSKLAPSDTDWDELEDTIDRELIRAYGFWAAGWRWAASEPGCGGPVRAWCCGRDSLPHARTHDRVARAVAEWHGWLEALATTFDSIDRDTKDLPLSARIERAAARVLALVIERTECTDAWYGTFTTTLAWYIERSAPDEDAGHWLSSTLGRRFTSWVEPSAEVAARVCVDIGAAAAMPPNPATDSLARWLEIRRATPPGTYDRLHESTKVESDGHLLYIERDDRARDAARAERMRCALTMVREAAAKAEPLDWPLLARCQRIVLGADVEPHFRGGDAFAKAGRERYGISEATQREFEGCLVEANTPSNALAAAAHVYLDVCFFHPFEDGNARAARLALDYVLTRAGLALHAAEPVFAIPRWADDEYVIGGFVVVLARFVGGWREDGAQLGARGRSSR